MSHFVRALFAHKQGPTARRLQETLCERNTAWPGIYYMLPLPPLQVIICSPLFLPEKKIQAKEMLYDTFAVPFP